MPALGVRGASPERLRNTVSALLLLLVRLLVRVVVPWSRGAETGRAVPHSPEPCGLVYGGKLVLLARDARLPHATVANVAHTHP